MTLTGLHHVQTDASVKTSLVLPHSAGAEQGARRLDVSMFNPNLVYVGPLFLPVFGLYLVLMRKQ